MRNTASGSGAWSRAGELAARTSPRRNRYVDFLRAAAVLTVVVGHWLMAAPTWEGAEFSLGDMLGLAPWSQWLTWVFQVMPLLFLVGGYANAASWESARRSGRSFGTWSAIRLRRLVGPTVPLLVVWCAVAALAHQLGENPERTRVGSQVAFIPIWFLAVYVVVVVVVPGTWWAWRRFGLASFWALAAAAAAVDAAAFAGGFVAARGANFALVWLAIHQLGYAWRAGRFERRALALTWSAGGLAVLVGLVVLAAYPVSMITVPGEELSNSAPPTVALIALACFHGGLVLAAEAPARRWLGRPRVWTATMLVNLRAMTLYLWHATSMVAVVGIADVLGGVGLRFEPDTPAWWASRLAWIPALFVTLAALVATFGRFERPDRPRLLRPAPAWRSVAAALAASAGYSLLADRGVGGDGPLGLQLAGVLLALGGAALLIPGRARD